MGSRESQEILPVPNFELRRRLLIQLTVFLILEIGFLSLVIICYFTPILCTLPVSSTQARAGLTVITIVWHTIAISNASNIALHGFSSEWYLRFRRTRTLVPGETDIVSTIAAGLVTRFKYFFAKDASLTYRISFVACWALIVLNSIAPGSINIGEVPSSTPTRLKVTNFTVTGGDTDDPILLNPVVRAGLVLDLEQRMHSPFGFTTQTNTIVGWPNVTTQKLTGDLIFESDVLIFNMSCWWERPSFNTTEWKTTWFAGGYVWYPWNTPLPDTIFSGGLMTMYRFDIGQNQTRLDDYPDPIDGAAPPLGMSGYIFFGRNSSIDGSDVGNKNRTVNLDGLPTLYNPNGFDFTDVEKATGHFHTPLVTFLLCDPQAEIMDGRVLLSKSENTLTVLSTTSIPDGGKPKVGNISPDAANVVLGLSLLDGMATDDDTSVMRAGARAEQALFRDYSQNLATPLPLENIQTNLTKFLNSAAKAFSSYIRDYDEEPDSGTPLFLVGVDGLVQHPTLALVANPGLLITTIGLVAFVGILLIAECAGMKVWGVPGFKLESLIRYGKISHDQSKYEKMAPHPLPGNMDQKPSLRTPLLRLLGFLILELVFTILVFKCVSDPIFVSIPLSSTDIKGGFTVLFLLWHTLAVFLASEGIATAFSFEWSLQRARINIVIPGETDRVSRLTSGREDQARYFFGSMRPSLSFRVAFILALLLSLLNSLAPGALSVDKATREVDRLVRVADLRGVSSNQGPENSNSLNFLTDRTFTLGMMEHHEDTVFRYDLQPGWVIPWLDRTSTGADVVGNVDYPTDVVKFAHNCSWAFPNMVPNETDTTWIIDRQNWMLWDKPLININYLGGILPLYRYLDVQPDSRTAYLFIGTNDTIPGGNKDAVLNLSGLPALFQPSGLLVNTSGPGTSHWLAPLSTTLVCDPHVEISGGRASLSITDKLSVIHPGDEPIGNLPLDAVNTIFTRSLVNTLNVRDYTFDTWVTNLAARVFLSNTTLNYDDFPHGIPLNNLSMINSNLDSIFQSTSKAFTDGLHVDAADQTKITPQTTSAIGTVQVDQLALIGTLSLGIVSAVLWVISTLGCVWLAWIIGRGAGVGFTLANIIDVLGSPSVVVIRIKSCV